MRFNTNTTSSLSSLPERIDHGNAAATGSVVMSANSTRTARNMPVYAVPVNLAGTEHPQHASYRNALQHNVTVSQNTLGSHFIVYFMSSFSSSYTVS